MATPDALTRLLVGFPVIRSVLMTPVLVGHSGRSILPTSKWLKVTVKAKWVQKIIFNISMASYRNRDLLPF